MSKVCVGGIVICGSDVLLGKRSFYPNAWDVFGGHVEKGESPEHALVREFKEELGITPTHFMPLEILHDLNLEQQGVSEYRLYLVAAWNGTPINRQPSEHSEVRWLSLEQAQGLELAHPHYIELFRRLALRNF